MEADGIEPNLIMLNLLMNAFGIAGRHLEAMAVFEHIKESVSDLWAEQDQIYYMIYYLFCPLLLLSFKDFTIRID